jgi:hypothetical protein
MKKLNSPEIEGNSTSNKDTKVLDRLKRELSFISTLKNLDL